MTCNTFTLQIKGKCHWHKCDIAGILKRSMH